MNLRTASSSIYKLLNLVPRLYLGTKKQGSALIRAIEMLLKKT